ALADLGADREHELAAHHRDAGPVGVARDRGPDSRPLARPEALDDPGRDLDSRGGLARRHQGGAKLHATDLLHLPPPRRRAMVREIATEIDLFSSRRLFAGFIRTYHPSSILL